MDYTPISENPPKNVEKNNRYEKDCCCVCWFIQILVWCALVLTIILYKFIEDFTAIPFLIFFYLAYLLFEFSFSPYGNYLRNKNSEKGIYEKMGTLFQTPPEITFECECYHDSDRSNVRAYPDGLHYDTLKEKIISYKEIYKLPYYTARDVSGLFSLNLGTSNVQKKYYIKLELNEEINFADSITHYDYENEKTNFCRRNRFRDVFFIFKENKQIPGVKKYSLVKISNEDPCMAHFYWFCFFTILTFSEFYKLYIDSCCIEQSFTIRKLISTRNDLNQPEYQESIPKLDLISQQYQYEQNYYNYKNENYNLQIPTNEELEKAKQYQNKIQDYQITNGEGQFKQDIIVDKPDYPTDNQNENSNEFIGINNSVAIGQDPISGTDAPPPNYEQEN